MIGTRGARQGTIARPHIAQLAAGIRASRGKAGYIDSQTALTVLNVGDSLPAGWNAHWDVNTLVVQGDNVTIDHYRINADVVFTGDDPTVTNCKIYPRPGAIFGVTINGSGHGVLTVTDTTVVGDATSGSAQVNGISSDSGLVARRCDVSNTGDGIHIVAQPSAADAIISQCYIHDQAFVDESQHCDGIQVFNNPSSPGSFTVEHTYVAQTLSTIGTPLNAALTCGTPTSDSTPLATPILNNNYFQSGLYHLRINFRLQKASVANNDIGPLYPDEFGILSVEEPASIGTWTNNRDATGALVPQPT